MPNWDLFLNMLFNVAFISFLATLLCRMNWFSTVFWNEEQGIRERVLLIICFSVMSIFATHVGTGIGGAILNCRMIGVMSAGILGGPVVGIATAVIAATHRYFYDVGGLTTVACTCSTLIEGVVGVMLHRSFQEGRLPNRNIGIMSVLTELMQMVCILLLARPLDQAVRTVSLIALPMIIMNTCGELVFMGTFKQILDEGSNVAAKRATFKEKKRTHKEREKRLLARAEFLNLQSQVNPHFLYNCLNTISYYNREKPELARDMLVKLASFYRYSADELEDFVPLESELNHVRVYLELEKARFEDRLITNIEMEEGIDPGAEVPSLILQPIVENAIKHGHDDEGNCQVDVRIRREKDHLRISVEDRGEGVPADVINALQKDEMPSGKVGLANVHKRLLLLTGKGLDIAVGDNGSTIAMTI